MEVGGGERKGDAFLLFFTCVWAFQLKIPGTQGSRAGIGAASLHRVALPFVP